jgi:RNA polymerase sigma factor (TIGR02999 family)
VSAPDLTRVLQRLREGDENAREELLEALYAELHSLARRQLAAERADHTLQSTALVNEAWIRLVDQTRVQWQSRAHFLAVASQAMRRILVDYARKTRSQKRGGDTPRLSLTAAENVGVSPNEQVDVLDLEDALERLQAEHPEHAQVVEMRFFGGMTAKEAAEALGVTERTAERRWRFARAWLYRALGGED